MSIKVLSFIFLTILALTQKSWSMEEVEDRPLELQIYSLGSQKPVTVAIRPSTTLSQIKEKIAEEIIKQRGLQKGALTGDDIVLPYRDDDKTLGELTRNGLKGYLTYIVRKAVKSSADTPAS